MRVNFLLQKNTTEIYNKQETVTQKIDMIRYNS